MKFDHFSSVLKNRVMPDPVFIPLTIKYLLENGPTSTSDLYDNYIDFLKQNGIPDNDQDPHGSTEDMYDLGLIHESIYDPIEALSLTLEELDSSSAFWDVEDFDGKGFLVVVCEQKIDTYIELTRQKKTEDRSLDNEYTKTKEIFVEFLGKQLDNWYKVDTAIVAKNQQVAKKKISAKYGSMIDPYGGIDSSQLQLPMKIFTLMGILIPSLRKLVEDVLQGQEDQDGNPWHKSEEYVPKHVIEQTNAYLKRSRKHTDNLHADLFIEYMGEGGLLDVIKHNWKRFFKDVFDDNKDILDNIEEINRKRSKYYHHHKMTPEEQEIWVKKLEAYTIEILWYTNRYTGR